MDKDTPVIFVARLLEALRDLDGIDPNEILKTTGVATSVLDHPRNQYITSAQQRQIYENIAASARSRWVGFVAGSRTTPQDMGPLGLALVSAQTVLDMLEFNERCVVTQSPLCLFNVKKSGDTLTLKASESQPMTPGLQQLAAEEMLAVWASFPTPGLVDVVREVRVAFHKPRQPKHVAAYEDLLPGGIEICRFDYRFPKSHPAVLLEVDLPSWVADIEMPEPQTEVFIANATYCERRLEEMDNTGSMTDKVRAHLIRNYTVQGQSAWLPKDIARLENITLRTLQRKLAAEKTTPKALINRVRRLLIIDHLGSSLSNKQLARLVGFSSPNAFSRWFRTEFGKSRSKISIAELR